MQSVIVIVRLCNPLQGSRFPVLVWDMFCSKYYLMACIMLAMALNSNHCIHHMQVNE